MTASRPEGHATAAVAERVREVLATFDRDVETTLARLAELYDPDVVFRDPLQTLHGREAFLAMNRRIAKRARRLTFDVGEVACNAGWMFLAWVITYEPHRGPTLVFEGVTQARVRDGLIVEHRDHWDLASSLARSLPGVRHVYAAFARRLG
jgi:hypothetical protein